MSTTDESHLRRAIALAAASIDEGGGPFGAVVARGDQVVAEARNRVVGDADPTAHAEVVAIRQACRALGTHVLSGCVLYASCEPCPMCLGAAWWSRVDRVVMAATREDAAAIGFDDLALYEELARDEASRVLRVDRLLRDEASAAMRAWHADPRRTPY
jgi:guanine deaminase